MEKEEICELGQEVLGSINDDMNNAFYSKVNGKLTLKWIRSFEVNAYACSIVNSSNTLAHNINISYGLLLEIYTKIDQFYRFRKHLENDPEFSHLKQAFAYIPNEFNRSELDAIDIDINIRNTFITAVTWVYFHELSHLIQGHGIIRQSQDSNVYEFAFEHDNQLTKEQSIIHHTTELAADAGATKFVLIELIRHFAPHDEELNGRELEEPLERLCIALAITMYIFRGDKNIHPKIELTGTHPHPAIRTEFSLPIIYESIDIGFRKTTKCSISRTELVYICSRASTMAMIYWRGALALQTGTYVDIQSLATRGLLNHEGSIEYLRAIIECWKSIQDKVSENVLRINNETVSYFMQLHFSEYLIEQVGLKSS